MDYPNLKLQNLKILITFYGLIETEENPCISSCDTSTEEVIKNA